MKKVIILAPTGIGDLIQILPVFDIIDYKQYEIDIMIHQDIFKDIVTKLDYFNQVIKFKYVTVKDILFNKDARSIIKQMKHKYDIAIMPFPGRGIFSALLMYMLKAKTRISHEYMIKGTNTKLFLTHTTAPERKPLREINKDIFEKAGILSNKQLKLKLHFHLDPPSITIADNYLIHHDLPEPFIGIYPGGNALFKRWDKYNWVTIIRRLLITYPHKIIIFLGPDEKNIYPFYKEVLPKEVHVMYGATVTEVLGVMSNLDLFIGNDGGLTYIYSLFQKKQITIFGATDHVYASPVNKKSKIILPKYCKPIWVPYKGFIKDKAENCINDVTTEQVWTEIETMLKKR